MSERVLRTKIIQETTNAAQTKTLRVIVISFSMKLEMIFFEKLRRLHRSMTRKSKLSMKFDSDDHAWPNHNRIEAENSKK